MELLWANQTSLHPVALALIAVMGVATTLAPRALALLPLILIASIVSNEQRVVIGGLDFNVMRILVLIGWLRVVLRSETRGFTFNRLDLLIVVWALGRMAAYVALRGDPQAFVFQLGNSFDNVGMYFMMRCLIRSWDDLRRLGHGLACIAIPLALAFLLENRTGRNMFSIFGGVPAQTIERGGRLRAQGAFSHPIIAGVYFAIFTPIIAANWWTDRRNRWLTVLGVCSTMLIVVACSSSTPVASVLAGMLGASIFFVRRYTLYIRWGAVAMLFALHMVMNKPVWHLVSRITLTSGNTGWHRYKLIDEAINRVGDWWMLGALTTADWGVGLWDVTNEFVFQAVQGGMFALLMFIVVLAVAFRGVGRTTRRFEDDRARRVQAWSIGVMLFMLCISFIAVAAFAQMKLIFTLSIALAGSLVVAPQRSRASTPARAAAQKRRPRRTAMYGPIRPRVEAERPA